MRSHCFKSSVSNLACMHFQVVVMRNKESRLVKDYRLELCKHEDERIHNIYASMPGD